MRALFLKVLDGALSLLFPPRCEGCDLLQEPLICGACRGRIVPIGEPCCRQCGAPFDPQARGLDHCAACRDEPPAFDAARAAGVYDGVLRRVIHRFKYDGVQALAAPLAGMMAETIIRPFDIDLLIPVPLHPARFRMRGFNQSYLLADALGQQWRLPVAADLLARVQNTTPQMQLPFDERKKNIRGAFAVTGEVTGRAIGLLDDVYTTGSTLGECSRMLKRAGAARVLVLSVARTLRAADVDLSGLRSVQTTAYSHIPPGE